MPKRRQYTPEDIQWAKNNINETMKNTMDEAKDEMRHAGDDIREVSQETTAAVSDFQSRRAQLIDQALRNYATNLAGEDFAGMLPDGDPSDEIGKLVEAGEIIDIIDEHFPGHGELALHYARMMATEEIFHPIRSKLRRLGRFGMRGYSKTE